MTPLERQLQALKEAFADSSFTLLPTGATLIVVPKMTLPDGWSSASTSIRFLAPVGYPFATPDCFWADDDLRLKSGAQPQASNVQNIPGTTETGLWFSWHLQTWNPNRDSLISFLHAILRRLYDVR